MKEGKRLATKPTLFYLMHCGKALYNNLLWKNWSPRCLPLVTIIGNCFSGIRERFVQGMNEIRWFGNGGWGDVLYPITSRTIEREMRQDYNYISKAVDWCEERLLPCPTRLIDVFSDTAFITFPSDRLNKLPQSTWTESPEPQYHHCSDLEIILKQKSISDAPETEDRWQQMYFHI